MKKFIAIAFLALLATTASAQTYIETAVANNGVPLFRIWNNYRFPVSCWYQDQYNYVTFAIYPGNTSMWYPVYGHLQWGCQ